MYRNDTHAAISCRFTTSADPNPTNTRPKIARGRDLYDIARAYSKFPTKGQAAEKMSADRNELLVYHREYSTAPNMAEKDEAPTSVAPKAPSAPSRIA
jgi:plasmid replication initiation protein